MEPISEVHPTGGDGSKCADLFRVDPLLGGEPGAIFLGRLELVALFTGFLYHDLDRASPCLANVNKEALFGEFFGAGTWCRFLGFCFVAGNCTILRRIVRMKDQ